jgi:hypothetical protein
MAKKRKKKRNKSLPGTSNKIRKFPGHDLKWKEQAIPIPYGESLFNVYLDKACKKN